MCASSRSNYCISIHLPRRREAAGPCVFTVRPSVCTYAISINIYSAMFCRSGRTCGFGFPSRLAVRLLSRVRDAGGLSVSSGPRIPSGCGCVFIDSPHAHNAEGGCCFLSAFALWVFIWTLKTHLVSTTTNSRSSVHTEWQRFYSSQTPFLIPTANSLFVFVFYIRNQRFDCLKQLEAPRVTKTRSCKLWWEKVSYFNTSGNSA